jgi:glycosyltransferase involved in cell wall biosynthesis
MEPNSTLTGAAGTQGSGTGCDAEGAIEVTAVMPCLNEADTLATCVKKAQQALREHAISGEVVVADNGSTDGSQAIARELGARVIDVPERGYGNALRGGIAAARGRFVLIGDADDSYDWREIPRFVAKWREGYELVQGCRLPSGGGRVLPGAMPFLHRWIGNPMFSWMVRTWFGARIHDVYCGLRGFSREFYEGLDQRTGGMEFATEMIIRASLLGARVAEVPITLHPDGRKAHAPHLKTFRDGWRTLRFFLMYTPGRLFLGPGLAFLVVGLAGHALALQEVQVGAARLGAHTLLVSSMALIVGLQAVLFALLAKTFAVREGLLVPDGRVESIRRLLRLERGLIIGLVAIGIGLGLVAETALRWYRGGFGDLDYVNTMRWVVPGVTLVACGVQVMFGSFLLSILEMGREHGLPVRAS